MTAPDATGPAAERQCPRCGTTLRAEQQWCLSCGAGLDATVARPRGWKWPVAVVGTLLALAAIAFALALVELAGNAEKVNQPQAAAPTPAPTAQAPAPTTDPSQMPPASGGTAPPSQVGDWPAGKIGYTVVIESSATRSAAEARATELAAQGISVGVLDSSGYASLTPQRFVVFSGQYASRAEARVGLQALRDRINGATIARVAPA